MGLLDLLRPASTALRLHTPMPAARVRDAVAAPVGSPTVNPGSSLTYNTYTGQGTDRDPQEWEWLRAWFLIPDRAQLEAVLRRSGVARKLVSYPAMYCTSKGETSWTLRDRTAAARPLAAELRRLHTAARFAEADIAACTLGNAAIWMQVAEGGRFDDARQATPLNPRAVTGVRSLLVLHKYELAPVAWQQRLGESIPIGEPTVYRVQLQRGAAFRAIDVHASRLILWSGHEVGPAPSIPASYGWGDDSVLLSALAAIQSVSRTRRATDRAADTYRMLVAYGLLPDGGTPAEQLAGVRDRWATIKYMTSMGVFLMDKGDGNMPSDKLEQLDAPLSGLVGLSSEALRALTAETPIPLPLLTGEFAGSLGGEDGQLGGWYGWCAARQATMYAPRLAQLLDVVYAGAGIHASDYAIEFAPLAHRDPVHEAEARLKRLQGDQVLVEMGAATAAQVYRSRAAEGDQPELQPALPDEDPRGRPPAVPAVPASVRREAAPGSALADIARRVYRDAADRVLVALEVEPASVAGLAAQVRAILPDIESEAWPHLTLVYVGNGLPDRDLPAIERAAAVSGPWPIVADGVEVGLLGDDAIVLHLRRRGLDAAQSRLLRTLAPYVRAEQFPRFLPHVTIGRLPRPLTDAEQTALDALNVPTVRLTSLVLRTGDTARITWSL